MLLWMSVITSRDMRQGDAFLNEWRASASPHVCAGEGGVDSSLFDKPVFKKSRGYVEKFSGFGVDQHLPSHLLPGYWNGISQVCNIASNNIAVDQFNCTD